MRRGLAVTVMLAGCFDKPPRPGGAISYVQPFVMKDVANSSDFMAGALFAHDAVVIHMTCITGVQIDAMSLSAPGWTFRELGPFTGAGCCYTDSFGAIAPNTATTMFSIGSTPGCDEVIVMGDEFGGADPTGGDVTFDNAKSSSGSAQMISLPTGHANDAVWAASTNSGMASAGANFVQGAMVAGNLTEYRLPTDPAGMLETAGFNTTSSENAITAITIKPQ